MAEKKKPLRQCAGCREMKAKSELVRVVRTKEGLVFLDHSGRVNGRGAYICREKGCLEKAFRSKGLERALHAPVPQEVYEALQKEMDSL